MDKVKKKKKASNKLDKVIKLLKEIRSNQGKFPCKQCGYLIPPGAIFCGGCSRDLDDLDYD